MTITFTPVFGFGQFSTDHPPGVDWINQRNADFLNLDNKFATATFSAGGILFANASNKIDKDTANLYFDPTNKILQIGLNTSLAKRLGIKRGTNPDSTGQPTGNWLGIFYNATNSSGENGLLIKNNWVASTSTLLEVGADLLGGAYSSYLRLTGDGGLQVGAPTGGSKGIGTVNAVQLWKNGTLLDLVFEPDYQLFPLAELRAFYERQKTLPTIPHGMVENGSMNLDLIDRLWESIECQARYLVEIHERLTRVEAR